jgi:tRNA pseudouridine55 synthase
VAVDGIVLLDKDEGVTSFEAVSKLKKCLKVKKAGHAGTLDKAASGLLVVCVNRATALQNLFMSSFKRYSATIQFGTETDTLDRYGKVVKTRRVGNYSDEQVGDVLKRFLGKTMQTPPLYSAIHKNGKRLYKLALQGADISVEPRQIEIKELKLTGKGGNWITIEVLSSKGTYIRSLGRDIAHRLDTYGYITNLRRLEIGHFSIEDAVKLKDVSSDRVILPLREALVNLPRIEVDLEKTNKIAHGIPLDKILTDSELRRVGNGYIRLMCNENLIAVAEKKENLIRYLKVFKEPEFVHS